MTKSSCATCKYKQHPEGGWCYMFKHEPQGLCEQHRKTEMKHPHADLLITWLNDTSKVLQVKHKDNSLWSIASTDRINPLTHADSEWRLEPERVTVGRHSWQKPLDKPTDGPIWAFSFEYAHIQELTSELLRARAISSGFAHDTEEAAKEHMAALICINRGDIT